MRNHATILREAGKAELIAERLGVSIHTVRSWIRRGSIPAEYWQASSALGWASLDELAAAVAKDAAAA